MPTEEYKKRKRAYIVRYQRESYYNVNFKLRLDNKEDQRLIQILESKPNRSAYIKQLIIDDNK